MTALMWAAAEGHPKLVRRLLGAGAEVNARDVHGRTALAWAADMFVSQQAAGKREAIEVLRSAGGTR